eukprot:6714560-Alexandrium_andersonii.AAC.1
MSASLVGSEMCIRDRPKGDPGGNPGGDPGGTQGESRGEPRGEPKGDPGAVSYTHLTLPTICSV